MSTQITQPQPSRQDLMKVYKTIFNTWRSQVDSSWQRSTYFSTFEIAAIGGGWYVVSRPEKLQVLAGIGFAVGGFLLTIIWLVSTKKTSEYVRHWWDSIREIERALALSPHDYAQQLETKQGQRHTFRFKYLVCGIPVLFSVGWFSILLIAIGRFICLCLKCTCFDCLCVK
jgi:hypothetical protein